MNERSSIRAQPEHASEEGGARRAAGADAMERLVTVIQELSLARDMDSIRAIVRRAARELTGADGVAFIVREGNFSYYADEDAIRPLWKGRRFPIERCISGWVMMNRKPVVIADVYKDQRILADIYRPTFIKSMVMVPIRTADPVGAIGAYWALSRAPDPDVVNLLQALADSTSVAMANVQLVSELERRVRDRTEELQRANEMLREHAALLDLAHDAILVRDLAVDGRIQYWNRGAEHTYGYSREEALGKVSHALLQTRFPNSSDRIRAELFTHEQWEGELVHTARNGAVITVASRWALLKDHSGHPRSVLEINRDINERKRAEESLKSYMKKLERSNRDLQDFAYVASHDLQEPLRKIQSFGDQLKRRFGDVLGETGRDYIQRMQNAANRMQNLIQSLLSYSRVSTACASFVELDLAQVVREVLGDLETRIEQTGGHIDLGALPEIQADPSQMRQLFQNLIGNALKFHGNAEPLIRITSQPLPPPEVAEEEGTREGWVQILVEDNGIGFEETYLDRIFAPFQRLHGRSAYEGAGMGLAICRRIAERHGGNITARSTPGKGSTFIVTLPLIPASEEHTVGCKSTVKR